MNASDKAAGSSVPRFLINEDGSSFTPVHRGRRLGVNGGLYCTEVSSLHSKGTTCRTSACATLTCLHGPDHSREVQQKRAIHGRGRVPTTSISRTHRPPRHHVGHRPAPEHRLRARPRRRVLPTAPETRGRRSPSLATNIDLDPRLTPTRSSRCRADHPRSGSHNTGGRPGPITVAGDTLHKAECPPGLFRTRLSYVQVGAMR